MAKKPDSWQLTSPFWMMFIPLMWKKAGRKHESESEGIAWNYYFSKNLWKAGHPWPCVLSNLNYLGRFRLSFIILNSGGLQAAVKTSIRFKIGQAEVASSLSELWMPLQSANHTIYGWGSWHTTNLMSLGVLRLQLMSQPLKFSWYSVAHIWWCGVCSLRSSSSHSLTVSTLPYQMKLPPNWTLCWKNFARFSIVTS